MRNRYIASSIFLMVGMLIIVQSLLGNIVAGVWQGWFGDRAWVISIPFLLISALLLGYDLNTFLRERTQQERVEPDERNRQAMLEKVRTTWIAGVLDPSLYKETLITLGLHARSDAVTRPMDVLVQRPHQSDRTLPLDKPISEVYDDLNQALLILGAPGAGKTTLLLELTRDLLARATHDPSHPIPVVFLLSSWVERRCPLADWLVDELHLRYDVPATIAQAWVDANEILPLLDGLDEVAEEHRTACVNTINTFRQEKYGLLPLVVSSRIGDYDALTVKLRLHGAVVVQPFTPEQVRQYLRQVGITVAPSSTSPLWELLDSPLMLNIAVMTYAEPSGAAVHMHNIHQDQLFAAYINRMYQRNSPQHPFSQPQTVHWLSWLAWQMQEHNQTVFYLEHIQPNWLSPQQYRVLRVSYTLFAALGSGLTGGLVGGFGSGVADGLVSGLSGAIMGGLVSGLLSGRDIILTDTIRWSWTKMTHTFRNEPRGGLVIWLVGGLIVWLGAGLDAGLFGGLVVALVVMMLSGLVIVLIMGLLGGLLRIEVEYRTKPNQGIQRSGQSALLVGLGSGLVSGLIVGVAYGLLITVVSGLDDGLVSGLVLGLLVALGIGLFGGLIFGGDAWLRHHFLRLRLFRQGVIPWRYVPFLDFAAQRILLRKVGGGYIFIHRLLLDYFAKQYTEPETAEHHDPRTSS